MAKHDNYIPTITLLLTNLDVKNESTTIHHVNSCFSLKKPMILRLQVNLPQGNHAESHHQPGQSHPWVGSVAQACDRLGTLWSHCLQAQEVNGAAGMAYGGPHTLEVGEDLLCTCGYLWLPIIEN